MNVLQCDVMNVLQCNVMNVLQCDVMNVLQCDEMSVLQCDVMNVLQCDVMNVLHYYNCLFFIKFSTTLFLTACMHSERNWGKTHTHTHNGGDMGGKRKKCRKERVGSVAANSDNLGSNKEAGGGAQGAQGSSKICTSRESVSPLSRLIRGFRNKYR